MIRLITIGRSLEQASQISHEIMPGPCLAEIAQAAWHPEWKPDQALQFLVGRNMQPDSYRPKSGEIVAVVPKMGAAGTVAIVLAVISVLGNAYSYWQAKRAYAQQKKNQDARKFRPYGFDTPSLTTYGEGFRIPIPYGEYRTGGAVIGARLEASTLFRLGTEASLLLCLGEGPIESIGGLTIEPHGERDYLTQATYTNNGIPDPRFPYNSWEFPTGLRINGLEADGRTVSVSLRKGFSNQSPMPDWPGAEVSVSVGGANLVVTGDQTTYTTTETDIWSVRAELFCPEGMWWEGTSGNGTINPRAVKVDVQYRLNGATSWVSRTVDYVANPPVTNPFSFWVDFQVSPAGGGPFDLRIVRAGGTTFDSGGRAHSILVLRSLQIRYGESFSYPNLALMSVRLPATEQLNGSLTNISIPIRGRKVRGWINEANGWTAETWGAVAPWSYPIGSNPAWVFTDLCLNRRYGFGHLISERDLDLESLRDWADLCDQNHPLDAAQPLLRFDGQLDSGADAVEAFVAIMGAGRAIPVLSGGRKLGVKFSYRDAFERGSGGTLNQVPDRLIVDVITTSQVRDFEITYNDPATAPLIIDTQYIARESDYEVRTVSSEDLLAESDDNGRDPVRIAPRRDSILAIGVARGLQVRYEAQLQHNFNRLSRSSAKVKMPIEAVTFELGDLVILQNAALLSGGATVKSWLTQSARTTNAGTVSVLKLTKPVNIDVPNPKAEFGVWVFNTATGIVNTFTADFTLPTYLNAGDNLPLWDVNGGVTGVVDIQRGAAVAMGLLGITNKAYEIVSLKTTQDLQREIELVEWTVDIFDMPGNLDETEGLGGDDPPPVAELAMPVHVDVQGQLTTGEGFRSTTTISWSPNDPTTSRHARLYARTPDGRFSMLGSSDTDQISGLNLRPGDLLDLHVCRADGNGRMPMAGQVTPITISVPEFGVATPSAPVRLTALVDADRVVLEWPHVDDSIGYEVRRGFAWYGAEVVGVTTGASIEVERPPVSTATYWVRSRGRSGLYSDAGATIAVTWDQITTVETATYLTADLTGGTADTVSWDSGEGAMVITGSATRGTWTSDALDVGADTLLYWSAFAEVWAVDEAASFGPFSLGQPSRFFESAGGRQPTRVYPGHDFDAGPATVPIDDSGYADPEGEAATIGAWVRVLTETRFHKAGAWGAWAKHVPGRRLARQMQARIVLDRYAADIEPYAKTLVLAAGF